MPSPTVNCNFLNPCKVGLIILFRILGASELLVRDKLQGEPKPLGKELYAGCVDSAGGNVLANILPLIKHSGAGS